MTALTDSDLYARGAETMLATWEEYARGAADAAVRRLPGVTAGVFPCGPERAFYNNALLERDLGAAERADAVEAMEPRTQPAASRGLTPGCTKATRR